MLKAISARALAGLLGMVLILACSPAMAAEEAKLSASSRFDKAALAPEVSVEVNVLVTIKAPEVKPAEKRQPVAVSLVLDRSGSMDEAKKMDYAIKAGKTLVRGLESDDQFALTVYDSDVQVLYPLGPVKNKDKLVRLLEGVSPGTTTFLSGGLEEGVKQLGSIRKEGPSRVILLSDGLANRGVTGVEQVAALGAKARNAGVSVSTIGLGLDFNEDLMQLLAQRGGGNYYYIKDSEDLPSVFKQEMEHIAESFTKHLRTCFVPAEGVKLVKVYGYSTTAQDQATDIEMGDLSSGEERRILMRVAVTPGAEGEHALGAIKLAYTDPADAKEQTQEVPVRLAVLADPSAREEAEKQHKDSVTQVRDEALLMEAEEAHVHALAELEQGNIDKARAIMREQQTNLAAAAPSNAVVAGKMQQMQMDEQNFEMAMQDTTMQKSMSKASKSSAYMSAKGKSQGIMLQRGDKGYAVEKLRDALIKAGFKEASPATGQEALFDSALEDAVKNFQKSKNMPQDGIAGPQTLKALGL